MKPLPKRLDDLAEVLTETTALSEYAYTIYEASAEIERLEKELAAAHRILDYHKIQFRPTDGEK